MTGTRAELIQFNEAVRTWAERFSPARVGRFAAVMGQSADYLTHSHYRSYANLMAAYRKRWRKDVSYSSVVRYIHTLEDAGIITVERRKWGEHDEHPGAQRNNLYTVQFGRVLRAGRVCDHDFYGATGLSLNVSSESLVPGMVPGLVPGMTPGMTPLRSKGDPK